MGRCGAPDSFSRVKIGGIVENVLLALAVLHRVIVRRPQMRQFLAEYFLYKMQPLL